jgi:hypothetical protein
MASATIRASIEASPDTSLKVIFNKANSMHMVLRIATTKVVIMIEPGT